MKNLAELGLNRNPELLRVMFVQDNLEYILTSSYRTMILLQV